MLRLPLHLAEVRAPPSPSACPLLPPRTREVLLRGRITGRGTWTLPTHTHASLSLLIGRLGALDHGCAHQAQSGMRHSGATRRSRQTDSRAQAVRTSLRMGKKPKIKLHIYAKERDLRCHLPPRPPAHTHTHTHTHTHARAHHFLGPKNIKFECRVCSTYTNTQRRAWLQQ